MIILFVILVATALLLSWLTTQETVISLNWLYYKMNADCIFPTVREPLVTNIMWRNLLIQVFTICLELLWALRIAWKWKGMSFPVCNLSNTKLGKWQALYQVTVLLILNFRGKSILHLEHDNADHANKVKNTLIFNAFVLCQVIHHSNDWDWIEFGYCCIMPWF